MPFLADSSQHRASSPGSESDGENRLPVRSARGRLLRPFLRLMQGLGLETEATLPVRVYYKFDSGCWRNRHTRQLYKVYRCR
jgi:hypothetical protein